MQYNLRQIFTNYPKKEIKDHSRILSAVLMPIFFKETEYTILFIKRSFAVPHHRGQISFPGGAYSNSDRTLLETALRESWEEIGLNPEDVDIIGELDDTITTTSNFIIRPFLGIIPYPYKFTPNKNEISEILEIPLSHLTNKSYFKEEISSENGTDEISYLYKYKGRVIWGATARILKQFLDRLKAGSGAQS